MIYVIISYCVCKLASATKKLICHCVSPTGQNVQMLHHGSQLWKAFLCKFHFYSTFLLTPTAYYAKQACTFFFSRLMLLCTTLSFYSENTQEQICILACIQYIYLCSIVTCKQNIHICMSIFIHFLHVNSYEQKIATQ